MASLQLQFEQAKQKPPLPEVEEWSQAPTPEEASRQADAQVQAQTDLVESTLLSEKVDAEWAPSAELALVE